MAKAAGSPGASGPSLVRAAMGLVEQALNAALAYDPDTRAALGRMAGRVIAFELVGPAVTVYLLAEPPALRLSTEPPAPPEVSLRGTPLALLELARSPEPHAAGGQVEITGDLRLARQLETALAGVDIDWEEMLAQRLGDTPARKLGNLARGLAGWARGARRSLEMNLGEYLRYETRVVVEREELDGFLAGIDRLRDDADRLEQRLARLAALLGRF